MWKKELRKRHSGLKIMAVKGPCTSERELGVAGCCVLGISHRPSIKDNYVDPCYNHATFGGKCDSSIVTFMSRADKKRRAFSMEALGETVPIKHLKSNPIVIIWREHGFSR